MKPQLSKTAKIEKIAVDFKGITARKTEISKRGSHYLETPKIAGLSGKIRFPVLFWTYAV